MPVITRKSLAEISEMVMTLREPVTKKYKKYTLEAIPKFHPDNLEDNILIGFSINWNNNSL